MTGQDAVARKAANGSNPLATDDQTQVTRRALAAIDSEAGRQGRALTEYRWKAVLREEPPKECWASFDSMLDDYMFNYAMKAANSDPNHPRIAHVYTPPHKWLDMDMPGSRWGGDNPDNIYRIIPIDSKARYRLDGKLSANPPSNVSYTLVGNWETSKTLNGIENTELEYNADGTYSITLDPEPANGRANHIQTKPGCLLLFIRDSLGDWDQVPNALTIHRLDPPEAPPLTDEQVAAKAAEIAIDGVPQVYWYYKFSHDRLNYVRQPIPAGQDGGLLTQRGSVGYLDIKDDEAMVLTLDPSDAAYFSLVANNHWWIAIDYANCTSSLNNGQVTRNDDGTVTFVIAPRDPGVHNWIDLRGQNYTLLNVRVQGLSPKPPYEPKIETEVVKVSDLKSVLPSETRWVTREERAEQVSERQRQIAARLADH